ncbi:MAG: DUF1080 domain-containing protein [Planctomycetaceae bacterium]|nr:DUF1080 domain-containing protein [Planctomycetaceae bacterium]
MGPILLFGNSQWKDFDMTVEVMAFEGGDDGFKVLFRATDARNTYGVGFGSYRNQFHDIWSLDDGKWRALTSQASTNVPGTIEHGSWYHVRLSIRDNRFRCELNGIPLFGVHDDAHNCGRVGFSTWDTLVRFRNVHVSGPRGGKLWQGLPVISEG